MATKTILKQRSREKKSSYLDLDVLRSIPRGEEEV